MGVVAGASALVPSVGAVPAAASVLGASQPSRATIGKRGGPIPVPTNWGMSCDVLVVGYGGAGAVSAITAFDAGANVLVIEKTPSLAQLGITNGTQPSDQISGGGGNTHISGGLCVYPTDPIGGAEHLYNLSFGATPMDVCQAWGTMANQNKAWL
ncbi:MAG: FAD-binding protein, partial [Nitrososphaerales archaeon]